MKYANFFTANFPILYYYLFANILKFIVSIFFYCIFALTISTQYNLYYEENISRRRY